MKKNYSTNLLSTYNSTKKMRNNYSSNTLNNNSIELRNINSNTSINNEIPTTPPSKKLLGNKKPFNPNPAESTPKTINTTSLIARAHSIRLFRSSLSACNLCKLPMLEDTKQVLNQKH